MPLPLSSDIFLSLFKNIFPESLMKECDYEHINAVKITREDEFTSSVVTDSFCSPI